MMGLGFVEGLIMISPHLLMLIAIVTVVFAVAAVFLDEDHIVAGVSITVMAALAVGVCIIGFWQGYE